MKFFLGAETYAPAQNYWMEARRIIEPQLEKLSSSSYGDGLSSIAIISIILPDQFFEHGGYKERRLYKRKSGEADIRLRIDFKQFIRAKPEQRLDLYARHIIECVQTLNGKLSRDFHFDVLLSDLLSVLSDYIFPDEGMAEEAEE